MTITSAIYLCHFWIYFSFVMGFIFPLLYISVTELNTHLLSGFCFKTALNVEEVCLVFRRSHGRLNGILNRFAEERHSLPGSPLVQSGRSESLTGDARRLCGLKSHLRLRAPEDSTCLWGLGSGFTLPRLLLSFLILSSPIFPCGLSSFPFSGI